MADKSINDLNFAPGTIDDANTLFVVSQSGTAYKVSGHEYITALGTILDGHGGVKSIVYTPPTAPSLTGTMVITLADDSTTSVSVQNGKGISTIAKTGTYGLVDTYTITYNDSTTQTFTVTNGAKGDTGDSWYVWIKYAGSQPTQDSDMGDTPDNWIGIYSGTSSTAPTHYTDYDWFEYKGEKGDTGTASAITTQTVVYQASNSGTVVPSGSWTTTIPTVPPGSFLWTRTQLAFNDGSVVTAYSVSRFGIDGTGAVSTVNGISPDGNGNVALTADDIPLTNNISVEDTIDQIETDMGDVSSLTTLASNCVGAINEVKTSITQNESYKADISLFMRIGVIGDSYASGEQYYDGAHHDLYQLSWGAMLARDAGISANLYAKGGQSVASFLDSSDANYNTYGYGKVSADYTAQSRVGLFIIALGLNDAYQDPTGASVSTFSTNLSTLIDNINTLYSSSAKILLLTFKRLHITVASDDAYNAAILSVGSTKSVPVIDIRELDYFKSTAYTERYDSSSHPTADNYAGMANAIKNAVEAKMFGNSYFGDFRNLDVRNTETILANTVGRLASTVKASHVINVPNSSAHLLLIYGGALVTYAVIWVSSTSGGALGYDEISKDTSGHAAAPSISYGTGKITITYNTDRQINVVDFCVYGGLCYLS